MAIERIGSGRRVNCVALGVLSLVVVVSVGLSVPPARADQNEQPGSGFAAALSAGGSHTCAVLSSGAVRCWGANSFGQLGLGSTTTIGDNELAATNMDLGGSIALSVSAGVAHTCALLGDGAVRCWGFNDFGQLGLGNTAAIGDNESPTVNVNLGGATATAITAGNGHTCALLMGGAVRCWGRNNFGQLGLGNTTTIGDNENPTANVNLGGAVAIAIAAGDDHTCAVLAGGAVRCWGNNSTGKLGIGNTDTIGDNENPTADVNLGGATAAAITVGNEHTCALLNGGAVRCWGRNDIGELGLGNTVQIGDNENPTTNVNLGGVAATAVSAGGRHTCALLTGGAVRCWGFNIAGQLGLGNSDTIGDNENPTVNVNLGVTVTAVTAGGSTTCALLTGSGVRCWGYNASGQLGLGTTNIIGDDENPSVNTQLLGGVIAVVAGGPHTCALLPPGAVRCWGYNTSGQLGLGNTTTIGDNENPTVNVNLGGATVAAIAAGRIHTCALLAGGAVRCWGDNAFGQLGLGNTTTIGDNEDPTVNVNLGAATATALAAGDNHTCALLTGGAVRCWGANSSGQLGLGNTSTIGDDEIPTVNVNLGGATATALTAGRSHTCALLVGGAVRCWGNNVFAQLGLGNTTTIGDNENPTANLNLGGATVIAIAAGGLHTCALLTGGAVRCWGFNAFGQLGLGNTSTIGDDENPTVNVNLGAATATAITTGESHTCAVLTGGGVRCWGDNRSGQLGLGNTNFIGDDENPTANANLGATAVAVTARGDHTCALLTGGVVRCWGYNVVGQLGIGNTLTIGDDEDPTVNVAVGDERVGPDSANPTVSISTPTPGQAVATAPVTITGTAADDTSVTAVAVAIYRSVNGGQFWNGTTWQGANTVVPAVLSNVGAPTTGWTYTFAGPPGVFAVAAIAYDATANYAIASYQTFSVADTVNPTVTLTSPTPSQAFPNRPVTIAGTAADNAGVGDVQIAVYRPIDPSGQFWNGTAWQSSYTTVTATLANPGATTTAYTYNFNPPQAGGYFYAAAIAVDTSYRYSLTTFTLFTLPDTSLPTANIVIPFNGQSFASDFTIGGFATDNVSVNRVGIAIYQASSGAYWNGTFFQNGFATVPATLSAPGNPTTGFTLVFSPPAAGTYYVAALPVDGNYNYTLTNFIRVTVT